MADEIHREQRTVAEQLQDLADAASWAKERQDEQNYLVLMLLGYDQAQGRHALTKIFDQIPACLGLEPARNFVAQAIVTGVKRPAKDVQAHILFPEQEGQSWQTNTQKEPGIPRRSRPQ